MGDLVELALDESFNFLREMFNGAYMVVHAEACVYVIYDDAFDPLTEFRKVNRDVMGNLVVGMWQETIKVI